MNIEARRQYLIEQAQENCDSDEEYQEAVDAINAGAESYAEMLAEEQRERAYLE